MGHSDKAEPETQQLIQPKQENAPPGLLGPAPSAQMERDWSTGLFDCCVHPGGGALGCVSLLMPCVQYGVLVEQFRMESGSISPGFCGPAFAFGALDLLAVLAHCSLWPGVNLLPTSAMLHVSLRRELRTKYNIRGDTFGDFCTAWWCGPCALAQETRELVIQSAARQTAAGTVAAATSAPPPALMGYMFVPHTCFPAPTGAAASASAPVHGPPVPVMTPMVPHQQMHPVMMPATGIPVGGVPPTQVATVTLQGPCTKADPA